MAGPRPFYHRFGWAYDLLIPTAGGPAPAAVAAALAGLGVEPPASVVDAGCGTGTYAVALAEAGYRVTALDRSSDLLDVARAKVSAAAVAVEFVVGDLASWTPGRPVDAVLCRGVLNDVLFDADRDAVFVAFARWLGPGGVLLADVRDRESSLARYTTHPTSTSTVATPRGTLTFASTTRPGNDGARLFVQEHFGGFIDGAAVDEDFDFEMRPWTRDELRSRTASAGFSRFDELQAASLGARSDRIVFAAVR